MARPPQNRPWGPAHWGTRAGAGCQRTPDSRRREREPVPSAPARPDIEHHSHTDGKRREKDLNFCIIINILSYGEVAIISFYQDGSPSGALLSHQIQHSWSFC